MRKNGIEMTPLPSADELHYWFEYRDGELYWKESPAVSIKLGDVAGSVKKRFCAVKLKKINYKRSRLVYKMFNPDFDENLCINHINHDTIDDRIENLIAVRYLESRRNMSIYGSNKSGYSGIRFRKRESVYIVSIGNGRKECYIGSFKTLEEAIAAREKAAAEMGYHENHGKTKQELTEIDKKGL